MRLRRDKPSRTSPVARRRSWSTRSIAVSYTHLDVYKRQSVTRLNVILFSSLTILVILGVILSFGLSNRFFIKPISQGLDIIKSTNLGAAPRTRIPEIDDLIDFLALRNRELAEKARQENLSFATLNEFLERTRELTPAERDVFKLYGEGYTCLLYTSRCV